MSYICRQCVRINFRHIQYVCNFFIDYIFINTAPATDKCCFVRICYAADFDCVFYRVCFYIFCSTIGWHRLEFWEIATAYNISPTAQWVMWQVIKSCCPKNTRMVHSCFFEKIKIFIRMPRQFIIQSDNAVWTNCKDCVRMSRQYRTKIQIVHHQDGELKVSG